MPQLSVLAARVVQAVERDLWARIYGVGVIEFESVGKTFGTARPAVVDLSSRRAVGQDHGFRRPVRLRQDHHAADGQPDARADLRPDPLGRHAASVEAQDNAAPADGLRHPERRAVSRTGRCWRTSAPCLRLLGWQKTKIRKRGARAAGQLSGWTASSVSAIPVQLSGGQQQRVGVAGRWRRTRSSC